MLHAAAAENSDRPVWFVHGARDGCHHPLSSEVRALASDRPNVDVHVAYSRPRSEDVIGSDYDSEGRVDGALLANLVENADAHYFLCGPASFMADVQGELERRNIPPEHIHTETF